MRRQMDVNSDMGESFGAYTIGLDAEILAVDRHRQHEAVVVVGVLANQVDPPGGDHDAGWLRSEHVLELVASGVSVHALS